MKKRYLYVYYKPSGKMYPYSTPKLAYAAAILVETVIPPFSLFNRWLKYFHRYGFHNGGFVMRCELNPKILTFEDL